MIHVQLTLLPVEHFDYDFVAQRCLHISRQGKADLDLSEPQHVLSGGQLSHAYTSETSQALFDV